MTNRANPRRTLPLRALVLAFRRFSDKSGWIMSSHVAMSLMLALFPFILFTVALAGTLSQDFVTDDLIALVFGSWPDEVAQPIVRELNAVLENAGTEVITIGGLLAVYFASNGVDAVRAAMSRAYHDTDTRPFWLTRLICIAFVIAGGAAILAATTLELVVPLYTEIVARALTGETQGWAVSRNVNLVFIAAIPVGGVLVCHTLLPARRHRLAQVLPGVVLTLALWAAAGWGFSLYVSRFAAYSATYAGLAGAMAALIFLYLNAAILIFGAEFNGALIELAETG